MVVTNRKLFKLKPCHEDMNATFKAEITNQSLQEKLLKKENIPALEYLLNKSSIKFERLNALKNENKLDFGNIVPSKKLKDLVPNICSEVNLFLELEQKNRSNYGYFNILKPGILPTSILTSYSACAIVIGSTLHSLLTDNPDVDMSSGVVSLVALLVTTNTHLNAKTNRYNALLKTITLEKAPRQKLIVSFAHEYAHNVQHNSGIPVIPAMKYSIFSEGHARGIEKHIAQHYAEREDNEAFLFDSLDITVGEIKSAYQWITKNFGLIPNQELLRTKSSRDYTEETYRELFKKPTSHAMGNALFSIFEARMGKEIYKEMIHGNFQFS
jgi:hypothetical protein